MPRILNDVEHVYFSLEAESHLRDQFELRMMEENRISRGQFQSRQTL